MRLRDNLVIRAIGLFIAVAPKAGMKFMATVFHETMRKVGERT